MLEVWLETLAMHTSVGHQIPSDLMFDIEHFKGSPSLESSLSSTPDGLSTPPATKKGDYFDKLKTPVADKSRGLTENQNSKKHIESSVSDKNCKDTNKTNDINNVEDDSVFNATNESKDHVDGVMLRDKETPPPDTPFSNVIRDIPKSPHLSKDFSPNGDRIRNSIRARRQERMMKQRSLLEANSNATSPGPSSLGDLSEANQDSYSFSINSSFEREDTPGRSPQREIQAENVDEYRPARPTILNPVKRKRSRPYGEKGFIINLDDGLLSLNNVKNLDNCSDFDSSCDTSLNYIDVNHPSFNESHSATIKSSSKMPTTSTIIETTPTNDVSSLAFPTAVSNSVKSPDRHKITLDETKRQLNLCKSKLEALEIADAKPMSLKCYSDRQPADISLANLHRTSTPKPFPHTHHENGTKINSKNGHNTSNIDQLFNVAKPKSPTKTYSMFSRLNPLSPIFSARNRGKVTINETFPPAKPSTQSNTNSNAANNQPGHSTEKPTKSASKLFRINDTPIFERRKIHTLLSTKLFKRSGSDDDIKFTPSTWYTDPKSPASNEPQRLNSPPFQYIDADAENQKNRKNGKYSAVYNTEHNTQPNDRTSPIRKYFTINQSKVLPKTSGLRATAEHTKTDRISDNEYLGRIRKNPKDPAPISVNKYSVKKVSQPIVHLHRNNSLRKQDIYDDGSQFGKPAKHIYVNCMDTLGCSSSTTKAEPTIGLPNKSAKFSSYFDYDDDARKMSNNDSSVYRMRSGGVDRGVSSSMKKPTATPMAHRVFRN